MDEQDKKEMQQETEELEQTENTRENRRKRRRNKQKQEKIRLVPIWLRLVIVFILISLSLAAGLVFGYGVIGEGSPADALKPSTWTHILDIINGVQE